MLVSYLKKTIGNGKANVDDIFFIVASNLRYVHIPGIVHEVTCVFHYSFHVDRRIPQHVWALNERSSNTVNKPFSSLNSN